VLSRHVPGSTYKSFNGFGGYKLGTGNLTEINSRVGLTYCVGWVKDVTGALVGGMVPRFGQRRRPVL